MTSAIVCCGFPRKPACTEICGLSVISPWNRLSGGCGLVFQKYVELSGRPCNRLWESSEQSFGFHRLSSQLNRFQESSKQSFRVGKLSSQWNRLRKSSERSFRVCRLLSQRNHLWSPQNGLWESAHYQVREIVLWKFCNPPIVHRRLHKPCVNRCAVSFEHTAATLLQNVLQVRTEVPQIPSNYSANNLQWFCGRFMDFHKLPCGNWRETYAANLHNSITKLWHVL